MSWTTDNFAALRTSSKYSDLEIRCDGRVFKVHRTIVCTASSVLAKECDGSFKESATGVIEHKTFSALTLDMMLQFMYTRTYAHPVADTGTTTSIDVEHSVQSSNNTTARDAAATEDAAASEDAEGPGNETASQLAELWPDPKTRLILAHIDVYAIADYYDMPALGTHAIQKISSCLDTTEDTDFIHVVLATYKSTAARDDRLRQRIVHETVARAKFLFQDEHFMATISEDYELRHFSVDVLPILHEAAESSEAQKEYKSACLKDVIQLVQIGGAKRSSPLFQMLMAQGYLH